MSRPITLLVLLQTLLVIVGFFVLGIVLKFCGYPDAFGLRWNPVAVFLREHGFWLLLPSFLWAMYAMTAQRMDRGLLSFRLACIVGFCLAMLTIVAFLYAAVFPFTRPLYYVPAALENIENQYAPALHGSAVGTVQKDFRSALEMAQAIQSPGIRENALWAVARVWSRADPPVRLRVDRVHAQSFRRYEGNPHSISPR